MLEKDEANKIDDAKRASVVVRIVVVLLVLSAKGPLCYLQIPIT
jgi:hypothetical protein